MKKIILASALLVGFIQPIFSQVKIGLNISPAIVFNRAALNSAEKGHDINTNGAGFGFVGGPELSFFFGSNENYSVTTGAWYAVKKAQFTSTKYTPTTTNSIDSSRNTILQYVQIPLTFKLYTNEIATDMKLYFQIGATADILIGGKEVGSKERETEGYKRFDSTILLGAGVKYALGENTAMLFGLRYTRGLINALSAPLKEEYKVINDMISLDLGIQF